jgi:hypothetical protein
MKPESPGMQILLNAVIGRNKDLLLRIDSLRRSNAALRGHLRRAKREAITPQQVAQGVRALYTSYEGVSGNTLVLRRVGKGDICTWPDYDAVRHVMETIEQLQAKGTK